MNRCSVISGGGVKSLHHGVQTSRSVHAASCSLGSIEFLHEVNWPEREADGA